MTEYTAFITLHRPTGVLDKALLALANLLGHKEQYSHMRLHIKDDFQEFTVHLTWKGIEVVEDFNYLPINEPFIVTSISRNRLLHMNYRLELVSKLNEKLNPLDIIRCIFGCEPKDFVCTSFISYLLGVRIKNLSPSKALKELKASL